MSNQFLEDVDIGLSSSPKFLSSRYFYDEKGDDLFVQIMNLPEYYLTNSEYEILSEKGDELIQAAQINKETSFDLVELGAGDGYKTKELIKHLIQNNCSFDYLPIDISQHALDTLEVSMNAGFPNLKTCGLQGDYFSILDSLKVSNKPKVVLFLGSNLGNLLDHEANDFLGKLADCMQSGDKLILGVDLIKSADIVLPAYNDPQKITARFNLNVLERMNRELGADFEVESFKHQPEYTEEEGIARSYLVSTKEQRVKIGALGKEVQFSAGEKIHTEISRKYNDEILNEILIGTGFEICSKLMDAREYFADYVISKN